MQTLYRVAVLPGDGIGPEVTAQAVKALKAVEEVLSTTFRIQNGLIGGSAIDATAVPLPAETISICNNANAILMGALGGRSGTRSVLRFVPSKDSCNSASAWVFT